MLCVAMIVKKYLTGVNFNQAVVRGYKELVGEVSMLGWKNKSNSLTSRFLTVGHINGRAGRKFFKATGIDCINEIPLWKWLRYRNAANVEEGTAENINYVWTWYGKMLIF